MAEGIERVGLSETASTIPPFAGPPFVPAVISVSTIDGSSDFEIANLVTERFAPRVIAGIRDEYTPATYVIPKGTTVIFASDLTLENRKYVFNFASPAIDAVGGVFYRRIFLIADTLRLKGENTIDARSPAGDTRRRRRGGDVTVFANRIIVALGGSLNVLASGAAGRDEKKIGDAAADDDPYVLQAENGGDGGQLILGVGGLLLDGHSRPITDLTSVIRLTSGGGLGGQIATNAASHLPRHERPNEFGGPFRRDLPRIAGSSGQSGSTHVSDFGFAVQNENLLPSHLLPDPRMYLGDLMGVEPENTVVVPRIVLNLWQVRFWEKCYIDLLDAIAEQDRAKIVRVYREYATKPRHDPMQDFQATYANLTEKFENIRIRYVLPLWHRREEVITPSGLLRLADLFVEGASLKNNVAPTEVLLHGYQIGGKQKVGFLTHSSAEDEITLHFDTEMTIPEWLEVALRKKLTASNEELSGIFYDWKVTPAPDSLPNGVKRVKISVLNETWRWEVTLDGSLAAFVMAQLASPLGLPFSFDWKFSGDEAIAGRTFTVRPSLARRRSMGLQLSGTTVTNAGTRPALIEYVRVAADAFYPLNPPLALQIGESKQIPLPAGTDPSQISIPIAAVLHEASSDLASTGDFVIAETTSVFETVTLENLIPARLQDRQQSVRYLEVQIEQFLGSAEPFEVNDGGKHQLNSESLPGSSKSIKFLRPQGVPRRYRVSGRIEYQGGGNQPLLPKVFDFTSIDIDTSWLPPIVQ
jgi:hypothetical protein